MKLTSCTICYNDEQYIDMMLESALTFADEIVIVDGGSTDLTVDIIKQFQKEHPNKIKLIIGPEVAPEIYEKQLKDKRGRVLQNGHFGQMRALALKQATGDWIFWIDADEALSNNGRYVMEKLIESGCDAFNIEYLHFVHDFKHVDNSEAVHIGMLRFHKNYDGIIFQRYNHALPGYPWKQVGTGLMNIIIFHLGYAGNLINVYERYKRNLIYSEMHYGINQCYWRDWHYFNYAKKKCTVSVEKFPKAIIDRFEIGIYANAVKGKKNEENI